jgi:hypothetical protein
MYNGVCMANLMTVSEYASKGGKARAASLTSAQRTAIARKAAKVRWAKVRKAVTK